MANLVKSEVSVIDMQIANRSVNHYQIKILTYLKFPRVGEDSIIFILLHFAGLFDALFPIAI